MQLKRLVEEIQAALGCSIEPQEHRDNKAKDIVSGSSLESPPNN